MYIELDLSAVPPTAELRDPDDFKRFEVVAAQPEHVFVGIDELRRMAGERAEDQEWQDGFEAMLAYAESKGWVQDGAVRAHVEWRE